MRWAGDVDSDNDCDSTDADTITTLATAKSGAGTGIADVTYNADADLNRDGVISAISDDIGVFNTYWLNKTPVGGGLISDPSSSDNVFGYDGYVFNSEIKSYCVRFRWYEPVLARWLQRDAETYNGFNLYAYTSSDPIKWVDPLGLCKVEVRYSKIGPGYAHTYIVVTDKSGKQWFIRGGPSKGGPSSGSSALSSGTGGKSSNSCGCGSSSPNSSNSSSPGSGNPNTGKSTGSKGPWGPVVVDHGEYLPGTIDYAVGDPARTLRDDDTDCTELIKQLIKAGEEIDQSQSPYNPVDTNSNAVVRELLDKVDIPLPDDHAIWSPGWDADIDCGDSAGETRRQEEERKRQERERIRRDQLRREGIGLPYSRKLLY